MLTEINCIGYQLNNSNTGAYIYPSQRELSQKLSKVLHIDVSKSEFQVIRTKLKEEFKGQKSHSSSSNKQETYFVLAANPLICTQKAQEIKSSFRVCCVDHHICYWMTSVNAESEWQHNLSYLSQVNRRILAQTCSALLLFKYFISKENCCYWLILIYSLAGSFHFLNTFPPN